MNYPLLLSMNYKLIEDTITLTNKIAFATIKAAPKHMVSHYTEKVHYQISQEPHRGRGSSTRTNRTHTPQA